MFSKRLLEFNKFKSIFFHFLICYRIPWILSWQYTIGIKKGHPSLAQQLFIRRCDKFNSPINLNLLHIDQNLFVLPPSHISAYFSESVSVMT